VECFSFLFIVVIALNIRHAPVRPGFLTGSDSKLIYFIFFAVIWMVSIISMDFKGVSLGAHRVVAGSYM
jgi:hypothetical protein